MIDDHCIGFAYRASVRKRIRHFFEIWTVSMDANKKGESTLGPHWEHLFGVERWVRLSSWQCLSLQFTFIGRWSSWKFKSCKVVANNNYGQRSAVLLRLDAEKDMNLTGPGSLADKTDLGRFWSPLGLSSGSTQLSPGSATICSVDLESWCYWLMTSWSGRMLLDQATGSARN